MAPRFALLAAALLALALLCSAQNPDVDVSYSTDVQEENIGAQGQPGSLPVTYRQHNPEAPADPKKVAAVSEDIKCDVCKAIVEDAWERAIARLKRGDETLEHLLPQYLEQRCSLDGLPDEWTVDTPEKHPNLNKYVFRGKGMQDYQEESGGQFKEVKMPDGSTSYEMQQDTTQVGATGPTKLVNSKTWVGKGIQMACRTALLVVGEDGGSATLGRILHEKYWGIIKEEDDDVRKYASSEHVLREYICHQLQKVCTKGETDGPRFTPSIDDGEEWVPDPPDPAMEKEAKAQKLAESDSRHSTKEEKTAAHLKEEV